MAILRYSSFPPSSSLFFHSSHFHFLMMEIHSIARSVEKWSEKQQAMLQFCWRAQKQLECANQARAHHSDMNSCSRKNCVKISELCSSDIQSVFCIKKRKISFLSSGKKAPHSLSRHPGKFPSALGKAQKQTATKQAKEKESWASTNEKLTNSIELCRRSSIGSSAQSLNNKATTAMEAEIETD